MHFLSSSCNSTSFCLSYSSALSQISVTSFSRGSISCLIERVLFMFAIDDSCFFNPEISAFILPRGADAAS